MDESSNTTSLKLSDDTFILLRDFIYDHSGIYFADTKKDHLEARLVLRLKANNLPNFDKYFYMIKYDPQAGKELRALFDSVTTNETSFFRSPPQIQAFQEKVLPELIARREKLGERMLHLWSAGCSTGEEPYTMGIVIKEVLNNKLPGWNIRIVASDISEKALKSAKTAAYGEYSLRAIPPEIKKKYFITNGGLYNMSEEITSLVELQYLNFNDIKRIQIMKGFDIIFCRNVLIYFDDEARKRFVSQLYDSLNHGGYLFIGHSESLHNISRAFKLVHFPGALGYKKE